MKYIINNEEYMCEDIFMKMFTTCIKSTGSQQMNNYL